MWMRRLPLITVIVFTSLARGAALGQTTPPGFTPSAAKPQAPVERLGPDRLRVGNVQIDTAKREVSVRGTVNDVSILEYVANTKGGLKAYESALELDTNAINFNLALILIGMDNTRSVVPRMKFDPNPPQGDPLEIWVEWDEGTTRRRIRAERLMYNRETKQTVKEGPWVYTGSTFSQSDNAYFAEIEGTLIGFMHTPSPIIESPQPILGAYGSSILNPTLNLKPGTSVLLTIKALPREK